MKHPDKHRSLQVPSGEQVEWSFGEESGAEARDTAGRAAAEVVFSEPDPRAIFIGNERLDRFLEQAGQTEVIAVGELLCALDCWREFEAGYRPGGRAPYHPRLIVGLILLGIMSGQTSLRQLSQLARVDTRAWWLTGGLCPDYSTLSKFLTRHSEQLTGTFFEELTREVLKRSGSRASALAGDGTVIQAAASSLKLLKQEAAEQAAAEAEQRLKATPESKPLQQQADLAREVADTCCERSAERRAKGRSNPEAPVSPTEPEAMVQPLKNKTSRASYKPSVVSNADRIITGQAVDPSNEPQVVGPMLSQSERITGQPVVEVQLDSGYFCASVLELCYARDINLLCAPGGLASTLNGKPKAAKYYRKSDFIYDEERDAYHCPAGHTLHRGKYWKGTGKRAARVLYSGAPCGRCELRSGCLRGKGKRSITRFEHEELAEAQLAVMDQQAAKRRYRKRQGMVEPVFGELRYVQHMVRFRRRGMLAVKLEFALHCSAHNLRRYAALKRRRTADAANQRQPGRAGRLIWLRLTVVGWMGPQG